MQLIPTTNLIRCKVVNKYYSVLKSIMTTATRRS